MEQPTQAINNIVETAELEIAHRAPEYSLDTLKTLGENQQLKTNKFLMPGTYGSASLQHPVYQFKDDYVFQGELLGSGFWSNVYVSRQYTRISDDLWISKICVVKKQKTDNVLRGILNSIFNIKEKMLKEASILCGTILEIEYQTLITRFKYSGKCLTSFLNNEINTVKSITANQWLTAFINLALQLDSKHEEDKIIHGDVKPDNICILLDIDSDGCIVIKGLNLIDWASAHKPGDPDLPGDFNYQPFESYFFPKSKNQKTDIFSLGRTFFYTLNKINKETFTDQTLAECEKLFRQMDSIMQSDRPTLRSVIDTLIKIKTECEAANVQKPASTSNQVTETNHNRATPL